MSIILSPSIHHCFLLGLVRLLCLQAPSALHRGLADPDEVGSFLRPFLDVLPRYCLWICCVPFTCSYSTLLKNRSHSTPSESKTFFCSSYLRTPSSATPSPRTHTKAWESLCAPLFPFWGADNGSIMPAFT